MKSVNEIYLIVFFYAFFATVVSCSQCALAFIQEPVDFHEVIKSWKSVAQTPLYGEVMVETDTTGGVSFPPMQKRVRNLVGKKGYLSIIEFIDPKKPSSVRALNDDYGFTLNIHDDSTPVLVDFLWAAELNKFPDGARSYFDVKFDELRLHPALYISDKFTWLDIVESEGFTITAIKEANDPNQSVRYRFSCNPTLAELDAKKRVFFIKNGVLELGNREQGFLPLEYSMTFSRKAGAAEGQVKIRHEYAQIETGEWRLKESRQDRDYKGRRDIEKNTFVTLSTKVPSDREFRLAKFGLEEPKSPRRWYSSIAPWAVGLVVLLLIGIALNKWHSI